MPGTVSEKIFSFEAREIKEGQLIGRTSSADFFNIVPDGKMTVKYVVLLYFKRELSNAPYCKLLGLKKSCPFFDAIRNKTKTNRDCSIIGALSGL